MSSDINESPSLKRTENITTIEIPGKGRVHLIYGVHGYASRIPDFLEHTIGQSDAFAIESMADYVSDPQMIISILENMYPQLNDYRPKSTGKPFYLVDADLTESLDGSKGNIIELTEIALGIILLRNTVQARRRFLKVLGGVMLGYGFSVKGAEAARIMTAFTGVAPSLTASMRNAVDTAHPELRKIMVKLRNLIMAYKLISIMNSGVGNISMFVGAQHTGLEDILEMYANEEISLDSMAQELRNAKQKINGSHTYDKIGKFWFDKEKNNWLYQVYDLPI